MSRMPVLPVEAAHVLPLLGELRHVPGQSVGVHRKADGRAERYRSMTCRHTTWGGRDQS